MVGSQQVLPGINDRSRRENGHVDADRVTLRRPFPTAMATRDRLAAHSPQQPQRPQRSSTSPASAFAALPASSTASSLSHSQPVSANALLRLHEAARDPKLAALEQAVNERNVLAAQNTQLWKLVEKQRSGYNQILKEVDRIRGERDACKTKLVALGGSVDRKSHRAADRKTRTDSPDTPSRQLSQDSSPSSPLIRLAFSHFPQVLRAYIPRAHSTTLCATTTTPRLPA
jgi:hypothetical protein